MAGTKGAKSDKEWRDAIRLAVHELRDDPDDGESVKALRLLARSLVDAGIDGDISAMKEIGDRLDGKPKQVVGGDENGKPIEVIHRVVLSSQDTDG